MQVYFAVEVEEGNLHKSQGTFVPSTMPRHKVITYVHGLMFEEGWCPDTPHAIYGKDDLGGTYECIYVEDLDLEQYVV